MSFSDNSSKFSTNVGDEEVSNKQPEVLSVSQLNQFIRGCLEESFSNFWLKAEVSNFTAHSSGHWYFTLKDKKSQISAVMFRGMNSRLKFRPETGMEVLIRGRISVYEPRGNYQVLCEYMEPAGVGALQKAFEQLKEKLQKEGLFDRKHKKDIPALPKHIAIVTSPTGAAIRDIINVLKRRYRSAEVTVVPTVVQGEKAAPQIVKAIKVAENLQGVDVMIVGRGGGSMEDLWCFNDEEVARAIFACKVPVISAVGHEIDFTISDFVSDLRAPTPSAAAELVAKNAGELLEKLQIINRRLSHMMIGKIKNSKQQLVGLHKRLLDPRKRLQDLMQRLDDLSTRAENAINNSLHKKRLEVRVLTGRMVSPKHLLSKLQQRLQSIDESLKTKIKHLLDKNRAQFEKLTSKLDAFSPLKVVDRGYSITTKSGAVVKSTSQVKKDDAIEVRVTDGFIQAKVTGIKKLEN